MDVVLILWLLFADGHQELYRQDTASYESCDAKAGSVMGRIAMNPPQDLVSAEASCVNADAIRPNAPFTGYAIPQKYQY